MFCISLSAAELVRRQSILPGTRDTIPAAGGENILLPESSCKSGTFTMWMRPEKWNNIDPAWHFFVTAGTSSGPGIWLYRFPDGKTRLLWILDKQRAADCTVKVNFSAGEWLHLAFTWQESGNGTLINFFVNGKKSAAFRAGFKFADKFPRQWRVGDFPNWTPRSKFSTALGQVAIFDKVLPDSEIAAFAARRYDENGALTIVNNSFIPCSTNFISGTAAKDAAVLDITFVDEVGKITPKKISGIFKQGKFSAELLIPDDCIETRITVRNASGKPVYWQPEEIRYADFLPQFMSDYWQASWIWYIKPFGGHTTRYIRKKFSVDPDDLQLAAWQWAADDRSEVFVNGVSIGKSYSWATPEVRDNLKPLLRKGENVIAARMTNIGGSAGFFGELSLVDKQGNVTRIGTDDTWKAHDKELPDWNKVDFDDSKWGNPFVIMRPPQLPYGMTPYRNFAKVPELKLLSGKKDYQFILGETADISAVFQAPDKLKDAEVFVTLNRNGKELYRKKAVVTQNRKEVKINVQINIPGNVSAEKYTIGLESRAYKFDKDNLIGSLQLLPVKYQRSETTAVVRKTGGVPTIYLNGKAVPSMLYRNRINFRNDTLGNAYITSFDKAGIRLTEMNISFRQIWNPDGSLNTDAVDLNLKSAIYYAPDTKFILFINVDAPEWYVAANKDEQFITHLGKSNNRISYASEKFRQDAAEILVKLVKYLQSCNEYDAIAGFGLDGGEDGQFMQWTGRNLDYLGDYSLPMQKAFHKELQNRYGNIDKLNRAWKSSYKSFAEVKIPSYDRRKGKDGTIYLDPVKDADVIAYNKVYGEAAADYMLYCAKTIKEATGNTKLISTYYGKFYSIAGVQDYGEFANEKVLASPYIDMLIGVEYNLRGAGNPLSITAPSESYSLHNKIYIDEADLRTFLSGSKSWGYAGNAYETVSMIRKMFIFNFVRGMGIHWYDLHGGMFENPAIINSIRRTFEIAAKQIDVPLTRRAEIAVIADEHSYLAVTNKINPLATASIRHQQNGRFSRIGAPYDMYLANDLLHKDFPEYKMYVFLNFWAPSPEAAAAVEKLKRDGKMLVFCGNAGMIRNGSSGAENVAEFTGIKMKKHPAKALTMSLNIPGKTDPVWTGAGKANYIIAADDPQAQLYGMIPDLPGVKPFAIKKAANYTAVHTAVPVLDVSIWRYLAESAGVHIYSSDPDTICYVGRSMLGIHCGSGGVKTVSYPVPATFTDAVTGEIYARDTRTLKVNMKNKETKLIIVKEK